MTNPTFVASRTKPKGKGKNQPMSMAGLAQSWERMKRNILLASIVIVGICVVVSPFCSPLLSHIDTRHLPWFLTLKFNLYPGMPYSG